MGRPKKAPAAEEEEEAPPPPYVETDGASSARPSTSSAPPLTEFPKPVAPASRPFPAAFNVYTRSSWSGRRYSLGEHDSNPLYALTLHSGLSGQPHVVLHSGPDPEAPPLATADKASGFSRLTGRVSMITLPALPNFGRDTTEEPLECAAGFLHKTTYSFSIEVETGVPAAGGGALRREGFEWRATHGDEVKELGRCSRGWKLVRLHGEADGIGGTRAVRDAGTTSDGKEVVAVFGDCSSGWRTKVAQFRFLGAATAGCLGPRFAIMAVITALRIWDLQKKQQASASAGASGGGAAC